MRMSTHSWGQTLTHKWNLATWVPGSLSWARTAADLASLSGAVSTRQDSKRRAWRGRNGRGGRGRGLVTSREPLPKSRLLSPGREAPCWHTASAEKLESSIARSAAVLEQDNERENVAKRTQKLRRKRRSKQSQTQLSIENTDQLQAGRRHRRKKTISLKKEQTIESEKISDFVEFLQSDKFVDSERWTLFA